MLSGYLRHTFAARTKYSGFGVLGAIGALAVKDPALPLQRTER